MKHQSRTIVFFGSGPVATKSLESLSKSFVIEAVITKPAKHSNDSVPVLDFANKNHLKTYTPTNRPELDKLFETIKLLSPLAILIDYGIILSEDVIDYFPMGIVNSHFSLLPEWRGPDPITFSILSGQKITGISLMIVSSQVDEGQLIAQKELQISSEITGPELTDQLINISNEVLMDKINDYIDGKIKPYSQDNKIKATYSRKLKKEDGQIDWQKSAATIAREIRAYSEWPKSYTKINDLDLIITKAKVINENGKPGDIKLGKNTLVVNCGEKSLKIENLKPSGKKEMSIQSFLAGYKRFID